MKTITKLVVVAVVAVGGAVVWVLRSRRRMDVAMGPHTDSSVPSWAEAVDAPPPASAARRQRPKQVAASRKRQRNAHKAASM